MWAKARWTPWAWDNKRMNFAQIVQTVAIYAIPVLFAITLHEAAHGYAARHYGDNTAAMLGRISLNPLRHIDPVGLRCFPGQFQQPVQVGPHHRIFGRTVRHALQPLEFFFGLLGGLLGLIFVRWQDYWLGSI